MGNQPLAPLPAPRTAALIAMVVHIRWRLLAPEVLFEKRKDLFPAVHRLLLAIGRPVVIEEAVSSAIVPMELVVLAVLLELCFVLVDVRRRRPLVLIAEQSEQGCLQIVGVVERRDRLLWV